MIKDSVEYGLISSHYGTNVAQRSRVPLMAHIDEGLIVLDCISAPYSAKQAFCLHPLLQEDADLKSYYRIVSQSCDAYVVMLAMEYRSVANEFLSNKIDSEQEIRLSPLFEVNAMLVADKVQNYKDFLKYHCGSHARSNELILYFNQWLTVLGVEHTTLQEFMEKIKLGETANDK
jgi:hypothetical protein